MIHHGKKNPKEETRCDVDEYPTGGNLEPITHYSSGACCAFKGKKEEGPSGNSLCQVTELIAL